MFPIVVLFTGIFMIWFIATGKAYQIVQIIRAPVSRRGSVNSPNVRSSGNIGGRR